MTEPLANTPADQMVVSCPLREITIYLYDSKSAALSGEKVLLTREGENPAEGSTDGEGRCHITNLTPGEWAVTFPDRSFDEWKYLEGPVEPEKWLDISLEDADGEAVPDEPFIVSTEDGAKVAEERLNGQGRARVEVDALGFYKVNFPERHPKDWWPLKEGAR
jgi:hypothetical protein